MKRVIDMKFCEFIARKPFSTWYPIFVALGVSAGTTPAVPMSVGVGAGVVFGLIFSVIAMLFASRSKP
jgi:hypothetical protein